MDTYSHRVRATDVVVGCRMYRNGTPTLIVTDVAASPCSHRVTITYRRDDAATGCITLHRDDAVRVADHPFIVI